MLNSFVCRQEHFESDWFALWLDRMGYELPASRHLHRKGWEWAAISQALWERGMLRRGRRGLGFACGTEPVVSLFAALGADLEATDLHAGERADEWKVANEYSIGKDSLLREGFIDRDQFERRVNFYTADMNDLSSFEKGAYDFVWSSCAVEHLGSADHAKAFLRNALTLLKPGGVSVHTTEINISSFEELYDIPYCVIFRDKDLRSLDREMRRTKGCIESLDLDPGSQQWDVAFDAPPYHTGPHIKLDMNGHVTTSVLLICRQY